MKKIILCMIAGMLIGGCSYEVTPENEPTETTDVSAKDALAEVVGKTVAQGESMAIPAIKPSATPGQEVTLEGKVMGTMQPFVENRAVMIIGDEEIIVSCDVMDDDDHCKTPWDVCCEDAKNVQAGSATIQVVGDNGQPLRAGLKGVGGLKELSKVRVKGVVAKGSSPSLLIVNAEAIDVL